MPGVTQLESSRSGIQIQLCLLHDSNDNTNNNKDDKISRKKKAANISGVLTMCQAWVEQLTIGLILSRKPLFTQLLRTKTKLQGT